MRVNSATTKTLIAILWRTLPCALLVACLCVIRMASAQTVEYKETTALLQTRVHLRLGETTLAKTLQEVSRQTGLQIQATDYLQERELLVDLDNMSAQSVLDTLAEGNDWIWYEAKQSQIYMARPKFIRSQELLNVAPAFRAIVPKDLRRFVGVDVSGADLRKAFRQSQPNSDYALNHPTASDLVPPEDTMLPEMLEGLVKEQERRMITWVTADVMAGKQIPYAKLTPEQQHGLIVRFVFSAMHEVFDIGPNGTAALITGLVPAGIDENQMRIRLQNGGIFVGTFQGGHFAFGEGLMSEK